MSASHFSPFGNRHPKQDSSSVASPSQPRGVRYCLNVVPVHGIQRVTLELLLDVSPETDSTVVTRPLLQMISPRRNYPDYITDQDAEWINQLQKRSKTSHAPHVFILFSPEEENVMTEIIASGRCYFSATKQPLRLSPALSATPSWQIINEKHLRFTLASKPTAQRILPLSRPYYYLTRPGRIGPLLVANQAQRVAFLLGIDEFHTADLPSWNWSQLNLPTPPDIHCSRIKKSRPTPVLMLTTAKPDFRPIGRLFFDYGGHALELAVPPRPESLARIKPTYFVRIERDTDFEQRCINVLLEMDLQLFKSKIGRRSQQVFGSPKNEQEFVWQQIMGRLDYLREQQWQIKISNSFGYLESDDVQWTIRANARPDQSINTDLFLQVQNQKIPLLPLIGSWFNNQKSAPSTPPQIQLPDGKTAFLDPKRVEAILNAFSGVFTRLSRSASHDTLAELPTQSIAMLAQLKQNMTGKGIQWETDQIISNSLDQLDALRTPQPIDAPSELKAELRDYQRVGLGWLNQLTRLGYHGILADDMGLGKTIQVIAHILNEKQAGRLNKPAMVIAPTSLLYNWKNEIERFAPTLRSVIHHGSERHDQLDELHGFDIVITSYTLLVRDAEMHCCHDYSYLVLDESQKIKNPTTIVAQTASLIHADHRLCLTGTPIENHLGELWSQFNFLMPGLLGSRRQFEQFYQIPIERHADTERRERLTQWLATFILRRTKQSVALELPPKTEIVRYVQMGEDQRELYETIRLTILPQLRDYVQKKTPRYAVNVLTALLKLRQVCCDPRLIDKSGEFTAQHSAKLDMLLEMVTSMLEEGRRILIFSQFTSMLKLISKALTQENIPWLKLTGQTRHRQPLIDQFQEGETPVFLISLKAGGTGLNLTAADVVIHYDPWWNPAVEQQATDRAHRIGQTMPVFSYKLIAAGTVEERIAQLQIRKQALAEDILSAATVTRSLDESEWESLFAPLDSEKH